MTDERDLRALLEAVSTGELSPEAAEVSIRGYTTTESGRFDAAREQRRGVPEAILAEGKQPEEVADLAVVAVSSSGRAVITRVEDETVETVESALAATEFDGGPVAVTHDERARTIVAHAASFDAPDLDAAVGVVTGGTSDAPFAGEAAAIAREMGASVDFIEDVGVAHLGRVLDHLETLREADVLVVAAGREGALPTVVAGLVDTPVIGLPTPTGYGHGGDGEAALQGMLQSCTVLSTVNIGAGYIAGAQAGLIARAVDGA